MKTDRRTFLAKAGLLSLTAISGTALLQACGGSPEEASTDAGSSPSPAPAPAAAAESEVIDCSNLNAQLTDSDKEVRQSVGYAAKSPVEGKNCVNCRFYQPDKFEGDCGGCQLFVNGAVNPNGWCKSWAATEA